MPNITAKIMCNANSRISQRLRSLSVAQSFLRVSLFTSLALPLLSICIAKERGAILTFPESESVCTGIYSNGIQSLFHHCYVKAIFFVSSLLYVFCVVTTGALFKFSSVSFIQKHLQLYNLQACSTSLSACALLLL